MAKSALFTVRSNESCPECGTELVIRSGKHGPFLGCSQYPTCDHVRPLKSSTDGYIIKVLGGQVCFAHDTNLALRRGHFSMLIGYSNYPECEHVGLIDKPDETAITCPQCRTDHLVQCRSHYGKIFHSCDRYLECRLAINFKPVAGGCPERHYLLLIEKKTAQNVKHFCTSKRYGEPASTE